VLNSVLLAAPCSLDGRGDAEQSRRDVIALYTLVRALYEVYRNTALRGTDQPSQLQVAVAFALIQMPIVWRYAVCFDSHPQIICADFAHIVIHHYAQYRSRAIGAAAFVSSMDLQYERPHCGSHSGSV